MRLSFSDTQIIIGVVFLALSVTIAAVMAVIAANSRRDVSFRGVQRVGYWMRSRWLGFLIGLGVVIVTGSLFVLPYSRGSQPLVPVKVTGAQFYWTIEPNRFRRGDRVRFEVTSVDVNHGFGLYTPSGKMIGSVQAMPGYVNKLTVELKEAGKYRVECLELCGIGHHEMEATFEVE